MSVATDMTGGAGHSTMEPTSPSIDADGGGLSIREKVTSILGLATMAVESENTMQQIRQILSAMAADNVELESNEVHEMGQMGARRIGSLALGIAIIGLVMNELSSTETFANSTGVIDVNGIFQTAGSGLQILAIGIIIAAASVLLGLWQGF